MTELYLNSNINTPLSSISITNYAGFIEDAIQSLMRRVKRIEVIEFKKKMRKLKNLR